MSQLEAPAQLPAQPAKPPRRTGETSDPGRRLNPRIIDSDWLLMRGMRTVISALISETVKPGANILDFGCGSKPYAPLFEATGARYLGADFDGAPDIDITADGRIQSADTHDMVVSFQVLEHVRDLELYFAEARRVLADDGRMILSTHGTWLYHPHPEDHRRWTRQGLINEIDRNGFEVIRCEPVVGPLAWTSIIRLTCWCFALKKIPVLGPVAAGALSVLTNLRALIEEAVTPGWVTQDNACVYVTVCRPKAGA